MVDYGWLLLLVISRFVCFPFIHPENIPDPGMLGVSKRQELTSSRLHANRFFFTAQAPSQHREVGDRRGAESDIKPKPDPQRIKWKWFRLVYSGLCDLMFIYIYITIWFIVVYMILNYDIYIWILVVYMSWCICIYIYIHNYMVYSEWFISFCMCIYIYGFSGFYDLISIYLNNYMVYSCVYDFICVYIYMFYSCLHDLMCIYI